MLAKFEGARTPDSSELGTRIAMAKSGLVLPSGEEILLPILFRSEQVHLWVPNVL